MTFKEAKERKREGIKRVRKISKQREKIARKRAKLKMMVCSKISCDDCIFCGTGSCVEFSKDGNFLDLMNWAKGKPVSLT